MRDRIQPKQVSQIVRFTPGSHRLSGDYRFREFVNSPGLALTVKFIGMNTTMQLHSNRLKSINTPWLRFE